MTNDHLADMLARLRNAGQAGKSREVMPYSKLLQATAETLVAEGYLDEVSRVGSDEKPSLEVKIKYTTEGEPVISGARRVSRLSKRVYSSAGELWRVRGGYGVLLVSTPEGVMEGKKAKNKGIGGEVLCEIW